MKKLGSWALMAVLLLAPAAAMAHGAEASCGKCCCPECPGCPEGPGK